MKTFLYPSILFLAIAITNWQCIPEPLSVNGLPVLEPKVVVSSQVIPGTGLVVFVSRTIGALDASENSDPQELIEQIAITDAIVILINDEGRDTLENLGSGFYGGIHTGFEDNEVYELVIENTAFGRVTASTTVMPWVPFDAVTADIIYNEFDSLARITYTLSDPPQENFYMINVQRFSATQELTSLVNPRIFTRLLLDKGFAGEQYTETFNVLFQEFRPGDSIAVSLTNISKPYYDYLELRNNSRFGFSEFASEPINFPSNVEGGLGWFNLHTPDIRLFEL
ncbi:MAG: DUF4249 domain-containing protein [Cyclobacteriaceae bacterium]|nr:DUF4249 domain-containing protein [Cyclobacteriaceae bacterium]